jgi:hypothetical protein
MRWFYIPLLVKNFSLSQLQHLLNRRLTVPVFEALAAAASPAAAIWFPNAPNA